MNILSLGLYGVLLLCFIQTFVASESRADEEILILLKHVISALKLPLKIDDVVSSGIADFKGNTTSSSPMTVLSAFVDIGVIPASKSFATSEKNPDTYLRWLSMFESIENPIIFFTDKASVVDRMIKLRPTKPTLMVQFSKYSSWAFSTLLAKLKEFKESGLYREDGPCSYPEYAAVTNAKFEFMKVATHLNYFNSRHFSWIDAGIYRFLSDQDISYSRSFVLQPPKDLEQDKLLITQTYDMPSGEYSHRRIMLQTLSSHAGGMWLARTDVMKKFVDDYLDHVEILAGEGLGNCEEQVIGVMYSRGSHFRPSVQIQPFWAAEYGYDGWYGLAYYLRDLGLQAIPNVTFI